MISIERRSSVLGPAFVATAVFSVFWLLHHFEPQSYAFLSWITARVASYLLGGVELASESGWPILHATGLTIRVGPSCTGASFLSLLAALLAWTTFRASVSRARLGWLAASVVLAIAATVLTNAARILGVMVTRIAILPHVPEDFGAAIHCGTGIAIMLPMLILVVAGWERTMAHAARRS